MKPRDLSGTVESASRDVESHEGMARRAIQNAEAHPDDPHQYQLIDVPSHLARGLLCRYGRGDTLDDLRGHFHDTYVPTLRGAAQWSRKFFPDHRLRMHFEQTASWQLLFALVCFDADGSELARLDDWFTPELNPLLYDMVVHAFVPAHAYAGEYDARAGAIPHEDQVVAALLLPRETWPAACAAYMRQWPKLMQPHGYREHVDERKHRFNCFPLHLGLAVCAYDVDDTAFRDLPFYPRDLVDYYRAHIRHTRDAWRTGVREPGVELPESARPRIKKTYALSNSEAYARWVELVCGEDPALTAAARKALGRRKTMPDLFEVMEALSGAGLALQADIKDDATLAQQVQQLCATRGWPAVPLPAEPAQGPARISAILSALRPWLAEQGLRLALLGDGGDVWQAVVFKAADEAQFAALCDQLQIDVQDQ